MMDPSGVVLVSWAFVFGVAFVAALAAVVELALWLAAPRTSPTAQT